jgi:hypothetical protein
VTIRTVFPAVYPPDERKTTGYGPEEGGHRSTTSAPHRRVRRQSPRGRRSTPGSGDRCRG